MIVDIAEVRYGRPAAEALARAIAAAKAAAPLAPVTVLVPSNFAGLTARRLLGSGALAAHGVRGIANVSFLTPFRLAELLAADQLLRSQPLTAPVLGAAVRATLAGEPGPFVAVADHESTEAAVAALHVELSNLTPDALDRVAAASTSARRMVDVHRSIERRLDGFHNEAAVAAAAAERPLLALALEPFGQLVWFLPAPLSRPLAHLLSIAFAVAPTVVIVGRTGEPDADDAVRAVCRLAGVVVAERSEGAGPGARPAVADAVVSVSDADEEVRAVVRRIVALAGAGTRLDRIGVFYPAPVPYLALLEQQLAAAELPANGPSRFRVAESVAGRTLLAALQLPALNWRRDRVMALVGGGPLRHGDEPAQSVAWERLSRDAGVVGGLDDWAAKLRAHGSALRHELERRRRLEQEDGGVERVEQAVADTAALAAFVAGLAERVDEVVRAPTWADKAQAGATLLRQLLGTESQRAEWPELQQRALQRVQDALSRLASLDGVDPRPSQESFVRALVAELEVTAGRNGHFGEGVWYGPLGASVGHDLDAVFVLGCAEGLCPAPRRPDALLSDAARSAAGGQLERRESRLHDQHRSFLAALDSAPAGARVLTFPRGDLRGNRTSIPSRWLLDTASALAGRTVVATEFDRLGAPVVEVIGSYAAGLDGAAVAADRAERDARDVYRTVRHGGDPTRHGLAVLVGRGWEAMSARRSARFTEWDGNLAGEAIAATDTQPLSASRLERWATCGFRYYLSHLLGLAERDDPERIIEMSALDKGSGVHAALERFLAEVLEGEVPPPHEPWSDDARARLAAHAADVLDEYEARGRTGRAIHWNVTRAEVLALLDSFLDADNRHRFQTAARPERVELPFGLDDAEPVRIQLPDGRVLAFRGRADRVDRSDDGTLLVLDYKSGRGERYRRIDAGDPVQAGTTLQLGLYAEAAMQHLGAPSAEAHYWMIDTTSRHPRHGYAWTEPRRARFLEVVTAIADGIEAGQFPAVPGEWSIYRNTHDACAYCDFDRLCPHDRGEMAEVKLRDPVLRGRAVLAAFDPDGAGGATDGPA